MQEACREMDNGMASAEAIYNFGVRTGSPEVRKFASIIIQNIEKGGSDVTAVMRQQADELMSQRRQMLLRKGDDAAAGPHDYRSDWCNSHHHGGSHVRHGYGDLKVDIGRPSAYINKFSGGIFYE